MGYAEILGGGTDGRYTIRLDYGSEIKTAILASLGQLLAKLEIDLATAQIALTAAQEVETAQRAITDAAIAAYAEFLRELPPGAPPPPTGQVEIAVALLRRVQLDVLPRQLAVDAIRMTQVETRKRVAYWNQFEPFVTREAWCVDYTEEPPSTALRATIEVPGEPSITLLAPGVRGWTPADGVVRAREIMSPEQAFFNAAILPGWQRHMPTFRWGTASAIDYEANTMTVALAPAQSSAQSLPINQGTALQNVPVTYMACDASAFEVGDRVVVQFEGQSWYSPRVVGFLDNPRGCSWVCRGEGTTEPGGGIFGGLRFDAVNVAAWQPIRDALLAETLDAECRVTGGDWLDSPGVWFSLTRKASPPSSFSNWYRGTFGQAFSTEGEVNIIINSLDDSSGIPTIYCSVSAPFTTSGVGTFQLHVAEFVVRIDGVIVFNVAMTNRNSLGVRKALTRGGLALLPSSLQVDRLEGYTLLIDEA